MADTTQINAALCKCGYYHPCIAKHCCRAEHWAGTLSEVSPRHVPLNFALPPQRLLYRHRPRFCRIVQASHFRDQSSYLGPLQGFGTALPALKLADQNPSNN